MGMNTRMYIPLSIVYAGLTDEYVSASSKLEEVKKQLEEVRTRADDISNQYKELLTTKEIFITMGRVDFTVKHLKELTWPEVLMIHELGKEMVEMKGQEIELKKRENETRAAVEALYKKTKLEGNN